MAKTAPPRDWMLPDETVSVRLMATVWADVAGVHDDLAAATDVDAWLDAVGVDRAGEQTSIAELYLARRLRDSVRRLAAQVTGDDRAAARAAAGDTDAETAGVTADDIAVHVDSAVRDLNAAVAYLPVPRLTLTDGVLREVSARDSSAVTAALARVAEESIALLGGPDAANLRACYAPGCVLYFTKTHPRREWCSVTCGNRVRAARRYEKVKSAR